MANQPEPETLPHERKLAAATHVASIFFPILGPVIALAIFRTKSKFVTFHALSALLDEVLLKAMLFVGGIVSITIIIVRISDHLRQRGLEFDWDVVWPILLRMGVTWALLGLIAVIVTVQSILQAISAYHGKWKGGVLSGRVAKRIIKYSELPKTS